MARKGTRLSQLVPKDGTQNHPQETESLSNILSKSSSATRPETAIGRCLLSMGLPVKMNLLFLTIFTSILSDSVKHNSGSHLVLASPPPTEASDLPENSFYRSSSWSFWKNRLGVPYFSNHTKTLVVTSLGQTTYLHCLVGNLGDRKVSWIRSRDLRIVAIGKTRYTQDSRFTPLHEEGNDVWALKIQNTRFEDAGQYECQVSYHDDMEKKMKKPVKLVVLDSVAVIAGSNERHVKEGSRLSLTCHILRSSGLPNYVYWYHNGKVVNYSNREGVRITTSSAQQAVQASSETQWAASQPPTADSHEVSSEPSPSHRAPVSQLDIVNVTLSDAGMYTCAPSNARNHSAVVHVVKGENLAMQRKTSTSANGSDSPALNALILLAIFSSASLFSS